MSKYRLLLAEDEPLITLLYEDELLDTEFEVTGTFDCNKNSIASLDEQEYDVAIVDVSLRDGPCMPLVAELQDREIPFLIVTAHTDPEFELFGLPTLYKPFRHEKLLEALREVVQAHAATAEGNQINGASENP